MSVPAATGSELEPRRFAGRYRLLEMLGAGGVGTVYRAHDEVEGRVVALKMLRAATDDPQRPRLERLFAREFHALARLDHPRIIAVYEYGVAAATPYYSMEFLEGHDLQQLSPLPIDEACRVLRDVASSLALLHTQRLLHRDVSPRNVRRTAAGRAKLIDFGALASFGIAAEVIGTPMCIAPEVLQGAPLDARTDLFALGAVAYWAVTGRAAYPARHVRELPQIWRAAPPPPSQWNPAVPPALDTLIMSLLHLDPLARPASAAAVIDRLRAIAQLPAEEGAGDRAAESYLASGRLVGRERERAALKERMLRALDRKGGEIALIGPPGVGRSRLLRETCLDAALSALVALDADAEASSEPYAVPIRLALQLLDVAPEVARSAAGEHAGLLSQLAPVLAGKLAAEPVELAGDPEERRRQFLSALEAWFGAVADALPILVAVDNLQAADADSLEFLAALSRAARERRLLVVLAFRTGGPDDSQPMAAWRRLRHRSHLRLRPLDRTTSEELMKSIFGELASSARIAQLLYERSGGSPGRFMALARQLVRGGIARYDDGAWTLPFELARDALVEHHPSLASERLAQLGEAARELALALSIHRKPFSVERCSHLLPERDERALYAALDELVAEQILTAAQGSYRFEHAALREAIAGELEPQTRAQAHADAADAWLERADVESDDTAKLEARVEAAFHLLAAGEESEGADMLAAAGPALLQSAPAGEELEATVGALANALAVYEREGRAAPQLARVLFSLVTLAFFVDRRVVLAHGERAIELALRLSGLSLARRLARLLGPRWGLAVGSWWAGLRFGRARRLQLQDAVASLARLVPAVIGAPQAVFDRPALARVGRALEPLGLLPSGGLAAAVVAYARGALAFVAGSDVTARDWLVRAEQAIAESESALPLTAASATWLRAAVCFALGLLDRAGFGGAAFERARAIDALSLPGWEICADALRMLHHAERGESEQVKQYRERVELHAARGGSTWQIELLAPIAMLEPEVLARDAIATRRIWEQLAFRARELPSIEVYADAAQAAYLSLRGEPGAAIALYERVLPRMAAGERSGWASVRAHFAEALNAAGEHARAKALAVETLAHATEAEQVAGHSLELERQLALAEAGLGEHAQAASALDALLARHRGADQPLRLGLLHKARAELALQMRDAPEFERQFSELEQRFRGTGNPALIAQCERIAEEAVRRDVRPAAWRSRS